MKPLLLRRHLPTVLCFGLGLGACGQLQDDSQLSEAPRATTLSFSEWCNQWKLDCSADPGNIESPTLAQWKATTGLFSGYLTSESQFSMTKDEASDAHLQAAMKILRVEDLYSRVQTRMKETDWQSITLSGGKLVSKAGLAISDKADSGLSYHWGAQEQTQIDEKGVVNFSGLSISGPGSSAPVALQNLSMAQDGTMTVGLPNQNIVGVPFKTIVHSLLDSVGVDLATLEAKDIKAQEVVQAVGPLSMWLNRPSRVISLNQAFFTKAAGHVAAIAPQDETGASVKLLASTLTSLKTTASASANLATITASSAVNCDWDGGEVKISLAKEFGLKRSYQASTNSYGLEFYGVQVSGRKSLGLNITVKRVETDKDKLIILDVPVVGKVELKWDDVLKAGTNAKLLCTKA